MLHPLPNLNPSFQIANLEPGLTEIPPKLEIFEPEIGLLTSRTATPAARDRSIPGTLKIIHNKIETLIRRRTKIK
jgi:hypothetical protein